LNHWSQIIGSVSSTTITSCIDIDVDIDVLLLEIPHFTANQQRWLATNYSFDSLV
jgi:hypothetical protein